MAHRVYDPGNIFAKILRGEIPAKRIYEDEWAIAFPDINPQAPTHVLVIPKGPYVDHDHFSAMASAEEIAGFYKAVGEVARQLGIAHSAGGNGYRLMANVGADAHQEVPHLHIHLFAGRKLGPMLVRMLQD